MSRKAKLGDHVDDESKYREGESNLALSESLLDARKNDSYKLLAVTKNEKTSASSKAAKFFDTFKRHSKSSSNVNDLNSKKNGEFSVKAKSGEITENKRRCNTENEINLLNEQLTPPKSLHESLDIEKEASDEKEVKVVKEKKKINFNDVTFNKTPEKVSLKSSLSLSKISTKRVFDFSYVVLIASFFAYMLASMLATCFGVFFESMESDLGWSRSKVALIGGVISAIQDLTGPISSTLTNTYGCRKTAFFGGLIGDYFCFCLGNRSKANLKSSYRIITYLRKRICQNTFF